LIPTSTPSDAAIQSAMVFYMSQALVLGMLLIGFINYPLLCAIRASRGLGPHSPYPAPLEPSSSTFSRHFVLSLLFYLSAVAIVVLGIAPWVSFMLKRHHDVFVNPFMWTMEMTFLKPRHLYIAAWWFICLLLMLVLVRFVMRSNRLTQKGKSKWSLFWFDFRRKFFHFVAVVLFVPSILWTVRTVFYVSLEPFLPFYLSHIIDVHLIISIAALCGIGIRCSSSCFHIPGIPSAVPRLDSFLQHKPTPCVPTFLHRTQVSHFPSPNRYITHFYKVMGRGTFDLESYLSFDWMRCTYLAFVSDFCTRSINSSSRSRECV
jgi:hypothetical protein